MKKTYAAVILSLFLLLLLSVSSLTLGFINALPIATLDGGCALEALLSLFFAPAPPNKTNRRSQIVHR